MIALRLWIEKIKLFEDLSIFTSAHELNAQTSIGIADVLFSFCQQGGREKDRELLLIP